MPESTRTMLKYIQERVYINMSHINNMGKKEIRAIYNNYRRDENKSKTL